MVSWSGNYAKLCFVNTTPSQRGMLALSDEERARMTQTEEAVMAGRIAGKSFTQLNRELGITSSDRVFRRAIKRQDNVLYLRQEAIRLEAERLDALQAGIWERATTGNDPQAVGAALRVLERRAKLFGLDFADMVNAKAVELEAAKVQLLAAAVSAALDAAGVDGPARTRALDALERKLMIESSTIAANGDTESGSGAADTGKDLL